MRKFTRQIVISKTPHRLGLAGATDLPLYVKRFGGEALSGTINQYVTITAKRRKDDKLVFHYALGVEEADKAEDLTHPYLRAVLQHVGTKGGLDITSFTDVPFASGLGSSGAFTVGLVNALWALEGEKKSPRALAEEASHIEIDVLKAPIGKHDQYMAAYGGICVLRFLKNGDVRVEKIILTPREKKDFEERILLVYSGTPRSASKVLFPVTARLAAFHSPTIEAMHKFRGLGGDMQKFLMERNFPAFAVTLNNLWDAERALFKNNNQRIDEIIAEGKKRGAISALVAGAGKGGFVYFICPDAKIKKRIARALEIIDAKEYPFSFTKEGSKIIFIE